MWLLLLIVLIILSLSVALGWVVGAAIERRRQQRRLAHVPPSAKVYEDGRASGFAAGYELGHQDALRGVRSVPAATASAAGTSQAPAVAGNSVAQGLSPGADDIPVRARITRPAPSPEEVAAARATRDNRNVNIALYSASLLLVVAGGLFIGAGVPGSTRAITISLVVVLFYGSGLLLHARTPRLRPAAVAFAGTGLALLPVAGLLFGVLTGEGRTAWFVTALIGTAAYVLAAVRLHSRVVAYLTLPFFLSIALSSVSLIGAAFLWYLTCSIGVAALLGVLVRLDPWWLPRIIAGAIVDCHRLLTPLALGASLVLGGQLSDTDRALLWIVATAYYGVMLVLDHRRVLHFYALRVVGSIAGSFVAWAADATVPWSVLVLALCVAVQVVVLLGAPRMINALLAGTPLPAESPLDDGRRSGKPRSGRSTTPVVGLRTTDLFVTFGIMTLLAALVVLVQSTGTLRPPFGSPDPLLPMVLVLLVGMGAATRRRGPFELLVLPGVLLGLMTPWSDPWRTEVVLILTAAYLVTRGARSSGLHRERFVVAARATVTVLAPVVVLVHVPESPALGESRPELAGLAFVALLVLNQAAEVVRLDRAIAAARVSEPPSRLRPTGTSGTRAVYGWAIVCSTSGGSLLTTPVLAASVTGGWLVPAAVWTCLTAGCTTALVLPLARGQLVAAPSGAGIEGGSLSTQVDAGASGARVDDGAGRTGKWSSHPGWKLLVEAMGPVSLVVTSTSLLLLGAGVRSFEILLAVAVVYFALMVRRTRSGASRGAYLLAAQLSFTVLTTVVARDLDLSVHGVFAVVAVGIALQEAVRVVLRARMQDIGLQASAARLSIALLGAAPVLYWASAEGARLDVLALHLVLLAVISVLLFRTQRWIGALYPALSAAAALIAVLAGVLPAAPAGLLPAPPLSAQAAAVAALACGAASVVLRLRLDAEKLYVPIRCGVAVFALEAVLFAFGDGVGWDRVLVAAVVGAGCLALANRERVRGLDIGGAVAVIIASTALVEEITRARSAPLDTGAMRLLLGAVLAAAILYAVRHVVRFSADPVLSDRHRPGRRSPLLAAVALGWSALAAVVAMGPDSSALAGSLVLAAAALLAVFDVPRSHRASSAEIAFLVLVAAAQRIVFLHVGGISFFWAAQWWVVATAVLAAHAFIRNGGRRGPAWLTVAASILSVTGLSTISGGTTRTQIWSLCGHVALLAAGVVLSRRLFSLWGAIGIALALLWFLRGFTFLLLTVAALLLIAFAIWKLNSQARGPSHDGSQSVP